MTRFNRMPVGSWFRLYRGALTVWHKVTATHAKPYGADLQARPVTADRLVFEISDLSEGA